MDQATWKKILDTLHPIRTSVEILLRSAKPISFDGEELKIEVHYKFHKDSLEEIRNKQIVEDVLRKIFDKNVHICCELADVPVSAPTEPVNVVEPQKDLTDVAEEIFSL